jgi:putative transposase
VHALEPASRALSS